MRIETNSIRSDCLAYMIFIDIDMDIIMAFDRVHTHLDKYFILTFPDFFPKIKVFFLTTDQKYIVFFLTSRC